MDRGWPRQVPFTAIAMSFEPLRSSVICGSGRGGGPCRTDPTPYLLTRYFGLRAFSTLYALTWTFYAAAGAIGPVILGRAFDSTGSYASLLVILALALSLAAAMNLLLPNYANSPATEIHPPD